MIAGPKNFDWVDVAFGVLFGAALGAAMALAAVLLLDLGVLP